MEEIEVIEIDRNPDIEDAPSDPPRIPGGDLSVEEWKKAVKENL